MNWFRKKKNEEKDAFVRLCHRIDKLYEQNPYIGKASIGIYLAELDRIVRSSVSVFYPRFSALLNREIDKICFRGIYLYVAPNKNEYHTLIGENLDVVITNQKKYEEGK